MDDPKNLRRTNAYRRAHRTKLAAFMSHPSDPDLTQDSARAPEPVNKPHPPHPEVEGIAFWSYPGYKICVSVQGVCLTFEDVEGVRRFISWMAHMSFIAEDEGKTP